MIVLLYTSEKIVCIKRGVTMNTNSLKTFIAVCEHAGFSAAAKELGYTQSTVSSQIKQLEAELQAASAPAVTPLMAAAAAIFRKPLREILFIGTLSFSFLFLFFFSSRSKVKTTLLNL